MHFPVTSRNGETIGSAVTNLDLHDIARAGMTYGIGTYWIVTPFQEQQELARQIIGHWTEGYGSTANPDRRQAFSIVSICSDFETAVAGSTEKFGHKPCILATCAKESQGAVSYNEVRKRIWQGEAFLLLFGTAWGLAPELIAQADGILPPLGGQTGFNHLSVRSAASIIMDRLLSSPQGAAMKNAQQLTL